MPRTQDRPDALTPAAFHILLSLADDDRHGLGIMDEIESRTEGHVRIGPGSLYGTIKRLRGVAYIDEANDVPDSDMDPRRRYYSITPAGLDVLRAHLSHMARDVEVARARSVLRPAGES